MSGAGASPPRALLVGSDEQWRRAARRRLEHEDYVVEEAASRSEALALLREPLPDALVCDAALPDGGCRELVSHLRQLPGGEDAAVLVASGRAGLLDKLDTLAEGADACFERPVDWDALLRRLRQLLERRRAPPARVLCLQDFEEEPALLGTLLASAGHEVHTLTDPTRLEDALAAFRPDLLLLDTLLPGMSGYDVARYLRQDPRYAWLPVLFLTKDAHPEARIHGLRAGGDDQLPKPVPPQLLLAAVAAHLERARLVRGLLERDGLTRLLNEAAFRERAIEAHERARRRPGYPVSLLLLELDGLHAVADRHGPAAAERVLASFGASLRRQLRGSDVVGHRARGAFAILLERLQGEDALRLATRLREELAASGQLGADGTPLRLALSAGLAPLDAQSMSFEDWWSAAADALHEAQARGKGGASAAGPDPGGER